MKKKTLLSWSSGKDSAWTLYKLNQDPSIDLLGLFTVINEKYDRASMHATRLEILHKQAEAAGLPIEIIKLPDQCSMEECNQIMAKFVQEAKSRNIEFMAFGDLFLEDIRQYREKQLEPTSIKPLFPLWKIPTPELAQQMLAEGLEAYISSVDLQKLPAELAGQKWDEDLLAKLPAQYDPCGENGEFHTIVVNGPMFNNHIPVKVGKNVIRGDFAYADIISI